ncbi:TIGR02266 family protein [Myxococcaceae bacterium GXIMD 01537]
MANFWVGDAAGRVLGPLSLQSLRELMAAGRLRNAVRASRDGNTWVPLLELEEIKDLVAAAKAAPSMEAQQAERLRTQLRGLQALKTPHEVFGVKSHGTLDDVRAAFFRMAKRFSPEHLAPDTHPELKKVSAEIFDFLSQRMRDAEGAQSRSGPAGRPPPVLGPAPVVPEAARPTPAPAAPSVGAYRTVGVPRAAPPPPTYSSEEFVGLVKRDSDRIHADIRVTARNVGIFMDHPLINLATGGLFIPSERPLRLGTQVELTLRFDKPERSIALRSSVIWENAVDDGRQPRGYGLRLSELRAEDRTFLQEFVRGSRKS